MTNYELIDPFVLPQNQNYKQFLMRADQNISVLFTHLENARTTLKTQDGAWICREWMSWPYRRFIAHAVAGYLGREIFCQRVDRLKENIYVFDYENIVFIKILRVVKYIDDTAPRFKHIDTAANIRNLLAQRVVKVLANMAINDSHDQHAFDLAVANAALEVSSALEVKAEPIGADMSQPYEVAESDDGESYHECFDHVSSLARINQNILLVGPSGSGKTYLARQVANKLERDFASQSCSSGMSESQLAGWLLPISKGNFEYVPSTFVSAYENGGVFLLDELDAADENTLIFINSALAGDSFYLPQRFEDRQVRKHDDFVCIGAANTFGNGASINYSGRNRIDGATLDRFRAGIVSVDYSERLERKLIDIEVYEWCVRIRNLIVEKQLNRIMSTRVMLDFTVQKNELAYTRDQWAKSYFADWSEDELHLARSKNLIM